MTYRNLIDLRDILVMTAMTNNIPEEERMSFMNRFEAASKTADEWLFNEQLPILLDGQDKAEAMRRRLDDQVTLPQ